MTDNQAVLDALSRMPELASLEEIAEEWQIMASIHRGGADAANSRVRSHESVQQSVTTWASVWGFAA
jgi:predicted transcriptional regulator